MEARINSYIATSKGLKIISIFGYSTKGIPGIELHGMGKLSKSLKEKIIYLTKIRELYLPKRRYVICVDVNELAGDEKWTELKYLEFPTLLLYWFLGGIIPIKKLDDCITQGWINTKGDIYQESFNTRLIEEAKKQFYPSEYMGIKAISVDSNFSNEFFHIDTRELLKHIPKISCRLN